MSEVGDLMSDCRELLDDNGRAATPESMVAGETAVADEEAEEDKQEEGE